MSRMSREEFERQAVLYAMSALSPEEARRFELERARRGSEGESLAHGVGQAIGRQKVTPSERAALASVTAPGRGAPIPWIVACLVLLVAAGAAGAWALSQRSLAQREAARVTRLDHEADSLRGALERSRAELAGQPRAAELAPLLAADDLVIVPLTGTAGAGGRIFAGAEGGALLVAGGLSALPADGTYQLWRRAGGVAQPVAALGDAPRGFLFALFSDAAFLAGAETVAVSAESAAGRTIPTEPMVLEGRPR